MPPVHHSIGHTGAALPPVVFGTSCLGNLYAVVPDDVKLAITRESLAAVPAPVAFDSAGKYGAGLALEVISRNLQILGADPATVTVSNKLGWFRVPLHGTEPTFEPGVWAGLHHDAEQRISRQGILDCWRQGAELLDGYRQDLLSIHDPDEFLAAAGNEHGRDRRWRDILDAYTSLFELKAAGETKAIGVGSKDWRVIRRITDAADLDWVMLACSFTIFHHPPELLEFLASLHRRGIFIVNSAVFHAGFLTGGKSFDYRIPDPADPEDAKLFAWRGKFLGLCHEYSVDPAVACVRFGMSAPGIRSVALNTGNPARVASNAAMATAPVPTDFWQAIRRAGLIDPDYPHLPAD